MMFIIFDQFCRESDKIKRGAFAADTVLRGEQYWMTTQIKISGRGQFKSYDCNIPNAENVIRQKLL